MAAPLLVTGAAGFIGARFVESCGALGIAVVSVDHLPHFTTRAEHRGIAFGRTVDRDHLAAWLERDRPSLAGVVHLGACADTRELDVAYLTRVNLEYSQMLWAYCTTHALPLVYASSAATYGDGAHGYDDDPAGLPALKPLNPYGDSKHQFDLWALAEERAGRCPPNWSGFKFFNVYGFGERHKGAMGSVVLHAFDQVRAAGSIRLFKSHRADIADGHQVRDFIAVTDVVDALHFALAAPLPSGIYNLGTGTGRTFLDLARATFAALKQPERIEFIDMPPELRERYQYFTEARTDRLRAAGYRTAFTSLDDGVRQYIMRLSQNA